MSPTDRVRATSVGSMPGTEFTESQRLLLGELPDLPHLLELPARGAFADPIGRALGIVADLGADLQRSGWRLTGGSRSGGGVDQRRARSLLAQDLDVFEELTQGFTGSLKIQVAGPWTLAATVERPRGDRVLADHGARRDLAEALAEGLTDHVADVRRRVPGAEVLVQVDEPALPLVLVGGVPTASGFGRHRSVDEPGAAPALTLAFSAITAAGAAPLAHCPAADVPVSLFTTAGAVGVGVDLTILAASAYDAVAGLLEEGAPVHLGVVPTRTGTEEGVERTATERILRFLDMLGLDPGAVAGNLVVTPTSGLADATPAWAREALRLARQVATHATGSPAK